jgi:hypothetical protein
MMLMEVMVEERQATAENEKVHKEEAVLTVELAKLVTQERDGRFAERLEELQTEKRELRQKVSKHHAPRFTKPTS